MIRIANGHSCPNDWLEAPLRQVTLGPIDYLALYQVRDLDSALAPMRKALQERGVTVVASTPAGRVSKGAFELAEALAAGVAVADAGACGAEVLALAPMIHSFQWGRKDYDLLAAGAAGGHVLAAGPQATGGNTQVDWQTVNDPANIGYPILEAEPDGMCVLTKHPDTGGVVNRHTVIEALLSGVGDPASFETPDVVVDLRGVRVEDCGRDRVRVWGAKGSPALEERPAKEPLRAGWRVVGSILYSWPAAVEKAYAAERLLRERVSALDLALDEIHVEVIGLNACHGPAAPVSPVQPEVLLRITARGARKEDLERLSREIPPVVTGGPPSGVLLECGPARPEVIR